MGQYGLSQPLLRREDQRLLTGQGRYADDHHWPDSAHAAVLRAAYGHARLQRLDVDAARTAPGVLAVYTAADLQARNIGSIPCRNLPKIGHLHGFREHPQPLLVADTVRYVGDAVAFVVAETPQQAQDALELIDVELEPLPAVVASDQAIEPDAPQVWDDTPQNIAFHWEMGERDTTETAFARAHRVVSLRLENNRIVQNAMEPRVALAGMLDERLTLVTNTQMPHGVRNALAEILHLGDALRVKVMDVGGSFGGKNSPYPEQALTVFAAQELNRPVKWVASRSEAFISDFQGRDNHSLGELALDAQGQILALRVQTEANLGAYSASGGVISPLTGTVMASNTYRIPCLYLQVRGVYTNTVPTDPYRGAGRPEITYLIERLMDVAAQDLGMDRVGLRRQNLIPPEAFPYPSPTGLTYEACDFETILDAALKAADWPGIAARKAEAAQRGKRRGIGLCLFIERCGGGGGLSEAATLRFEEDGSLTLLSGAMSNGQGHETAYSQIIHERLGLPLEKIRVVQGDTDQIATGMGTGGSWSLPMGGGAVWGAADKLIDKAKRIAAHRLEAAVADIDFHEGRFRVAGTDMGVDLAEVAQLAFQPSALPEDLAPGLAGEDRYQPANHTFPYGCHIAEVEVDPDTGVVELLSYRCVHDVGRALNPLLLAGQIHGGVVQGIGQALHERTVYDEYGQLLSGSYVDYGLPRADNLPDLEFVHCETTPSPHNPMNIKGCGEAGAAGAPPAVMNALCDALGVRHMDMPATPERVWRALR